VLRAFECQLLAVRLLRLKAGSRIKEHTDLNLGYEDGEIRLHIPIHTNPGVEFYLSGRRIILAEGECWYVNTSLPHRVANTGERDRIHLVIDCVVNDWVRAIFADPAQV
jgi:aspartyl/asparaginyl beta-hydroxylase (cupin superfamily)